MKNYLTLVLALAVVSSPAFASRARLESLSQDKNGSYFVDDARNIFLNPAQINNYKKKLWLEYGQSTAGVYGAGADSYGNQQAQGGFSNTFGDFTYGIYLGRQSDRYLNTMALANALTGVAFQQPDHGIDLFFGGEAAVKWGFDLYFAGAQNRTALANNTANLFAAKLGVIADRLEVFTTVGISSSTKTDTGVVANNSELKGKFSMDLGATYAVDNSMKVKANFSTFGSKINQGGTDNVDASTTILGLGLGWKKEVSKSVTAYSILGLDYEKDGANQPASLTSSANQNAVVSAATQQWYNIPLTLAAEAQATSWLAIRGSVAHSLFGQHVLGSTKDSLNNQTTVAGGLGLTFGDVQIDGIYGQSLAMAGIGYISPKTPQGGTAFGFGNNMLSRLAVTYNF